jgi:hypothetical protein
MGMSVRELEFLRQSEDGLFSHLRYKGDTGRGSSYMTHFVRDDRRQAYEDAAKMLLDRAAEHQQEAQK